MYANPEQRSLSEIVIEHWDRYFPPLLQFILPENVACLESVEMDTLTKEYDLLYPR